MIQVTGMAVLRVPVSVVLEIDEDDWDNMSSREQDELIDNTVDWKEACRNAELDEFEVEEIE